MATINGTNGSNLLIGTDTSDLISGGNGSDLLYGGNGDDTLLGGNGNDLLLGGDGDDSLDGGNGSDVLSGGEGDDQIAGGNGNDILCGGEGNDTIDGGKGIDTVIYLRQLSAYQFIRFSDGTIRITDTESGETDLVRNAELFVFTDAIRTADDLPFAAVLTANNQGGFDIELNDAAALDESIGSVGIDNVSYGGTDDVALPGNVENATLTGTADTSVTGNAGDNILVGNAGSNRLAAGDGNDTVDGGDGDDTLIGGSGAGDDHYIGGSGIDTVSYASTTQGITVDLGSGVASGPEIGNDTLHDIENVIGGSGDDILRGDSGDNHLSGGDGNDGLGGGLGGNDRMDGGNGLDRVSFAGAAYNVTVQLAAGIATIGGFTKTLEAVELVRGTDHADSYDATGFSGSSTNAGSSGTFNEFEGLGGDDTITGNGDTRISYVNAAAGVNVSLTAGTATGDASVGTDTITGGVNAVRGSEFDDQLIGSAGNDILIGGAGNDFLAGGPGDDTLTGGPGFDTASYGMAGSGVIVDLVAGTATGGGGNDTLAGIDAINGSAHADVLRGNGGNNTLSGNNGNDVLIGRAGDDTLNGGNGIDIARFFGLRSAYTFGAGQVTGPDGTDTTAAVELLQFDDAFMLGFGMAPINLTGFGLAGGVSLFGRAVSDFLTMGGNANGRLIDLGGGDDTLTLGTAGASYSLNLANVETLIGSFGDETVSFMAPATGVIDMSFGWDTLNLSDGDDFVVVTNAETVLGFAGSDTVTFLHDDISANQSFDLGFGENDTLFLAGSNSEFHVSIGGDMTVVGASDSNEEIVNLLNVQAGSTFDLGTGIDTLNLYNDGLSSNDVSVRNVENVTAVGFDPDHITVLGNAEFTTTVTAGGGADIIAASADAENIRFIAIGDSPYDVPFGGERDSVIGFEAALDTFVFEGISAPDFTWEVIDFGGVDILRIDFEGDNHDWDDSDPGNDTGWEMAIGLDGLVGTLTHDNFLIV